MGVPKRLTEMQMKFAHELVTNQKIIRTGKLEDLTAEQLETRMKEIINEYSPILEGVVLDDLKKEVKNKKINYSSSESSSSKSSSESESQS